jgi:hypothetical protein
MNVVKRQVLIVSAVFALVAFFSTTRNITTLSDTNVLLYALGSFALVVLALAYLDRTSGVCLEDKVKRAVNPAILPTVLLLVLNHPRTYKLVQDRMPKEILNTLLVKELSNVPTTEGVALHTIVFGLVYYFAMTQLQL